MKKLSSMLWISFFLLSLFTPIASAYTTNTTYYFSGVALDLQTAPLKPNVLIIVEGQAAPVTGFSFTPSTDLAVPETSIEFTTLPQAEQSRTIVGMTVLTPTSFESRQLSDLDFNAPVTTTVKSEDIIVLLTSDGRYFKLSQIGPDHFEGVELIPDSAPTPEPGTLFLLGLGLIGLLGLTRRQKRASHRVFFLLFIGFCASIWFHAQPVFAKDFDCDKAKGISRTECEALVAFYKSTGGEHWLNNGGWLQTPKPCKQWFGVECQWQHVRSIRLSHNNLQGPIPKEIQAFTRLRELSLADNSLSGSLQKEIGDLPYLTILDLGTNNLTGKVPEELANLTALKTLHLDNNQLSSELPEALTNIALETFTFHETFLCEPQVQVFQSWLASIPQLQRSDLVCEQYFAFDEYGGSWYDVEKSQSLSNQEESSSPTPENGSDSAFSWSAAGTHTRSWTGWRTEAFENRYGGSWYRYNRRSQSLVNQQENSSPTPESESDDALCWAAAAANILAWSGWGTEAFESALDIYQDFQSHWTNAGGLVEYAWNWWFDGTAADIPTDEEWAQVDIPGGGAYWSSEDFFSSYMEWGALNSVEATKIYLEEGYGVAISVYEDPDLLGHSLTVWGYETNNLGMTTGLWVTDSDDAVEDLILLPLTYDSESLLWSLADPAYEGWYIGSVSALNRAALPNDPNTITITALAGSHGEISPEGFIAVALGAGQGFIITPEAGYRVEKLLVDETELDLSALHDPDSAEPRPAALSSNAFGMTGVYSLTYSFENVIVPHTIQAIFLPAHELVTIKATTAILKTADYEPDDDNDDDKEKKDKDKEKKDKEKDIGGLIWPTGEVEVEKLTDQTFTITPDRDYRIADVVVDGQSLGPMAAYTFEHILSSHEIRAEFVENTENLAIIRKKCVFIDEATGTVEEVACGTEVDGIVVDGTLMIGEEECGTGCSGDVIPFSDLAGVILEAMPDQGSIFIQWENTDGATLQGILYVNEDIVVTAVIGRSASN